MSVASVALPYSSALHTSLASVQIPWPHAVYRLPAKAVCIVWCLQEIPYLTQRKFASVSPSTRYVLYINMAQHSPVNSSTYGCFSYRAFNVSTFCEFLSIWSNLLSSVIHTCCLSMFLVIIFFISCSPKWGKDFFVTCWMVTKMMRHYFHSLTHSGGTWVSSEIYINCSRTILCCSAFLQQDSNFYPKFSILFLGFWSSWAFEFFVKGFHKGVMRMLAFCCRPLNINTALFK